MRIVLLGDFPQDPNRIIGGPQAVLTYLVRGFQKLSDVTIDVVTLSHAEKQDRVDEHYGATIHYLSQPRLPVELLFPWVRRRVHAKIRELRPDLVHAHNARLFSWLAVSSGYPSVVVAHGIHGEVHQYKQNRIDRVRHGLRDRLLLRHFQSQVEHLICMSPYIADGYRGRTRARMYAIENPIDDAFFDLDDSKSVPGRVLYAGLLIPRKNPQLLVDAMDQVVEHVPGVSVHFAGGTSDPAYARRLRASATKAGLEPYITFLGHMSEREIIEEYRTASVVVLPSNQETSPMVIQQAMAAGKPVIATRAGGIPYLVSDGETGFLIDRGDKDVLASRLATVLTDPALAERFGRNARAQAEARFRADAVAQRTADVYREILSKRSVSDDRVSEPAPEALAHASGRWSGDS